MKHLINRFSSAGGRTAFTLIELMISIGLIVILMLGINQVFKMSSDAVGAGQTLSGMTRDSRAAATVLQDDARMWVKDSPIFYIRSERDPVTGQRRDFMAFFARGSYHRHTAQGTAFSSQTTSAEAYIWFGHLLAPGSSAFLSRNIVGRACILLKDPAVIPLDPLTNLQEPYLMRSSANPPNLTPLTSGSAGGGKSIRLGIDLAGTTIDQFRTDLNSLRDTIVRMNSERFDGPLPLCKWWSDRPLVFRFQATPSGSVGNVKYPPAQRLSLAAPIFMENVSELIIEYAGDFVTQDPATGDVTAFKPDGVLDYVIPNDPTFAFAGSVRTRWYGLPRDVDGDNSPLVFKGSYRTPDVLPLASVLQAYNINTTGAFERELPGSGYTCLWANGSPRLVRMTIKIDDPARRIQGGAWYEYLLGPQ